MLLELPLAFKRSIVKHAETVKKVRPVGSGRGTAEFAIQHGGARKYRGRVMMQH